MSKLTGAEIRQKWLTFFQQKQHVLVESKSLVPVNDDSLLWINAGIATLKNYFSGKSVPPAPRLVNSQRCIRTNDIENVGVTSRHQTLFEMLGNFSIGDYFKQEAIAWAYELLTGVYKLDKNRLFITIFEADDEAYAAWIKAGIEPSHIVRCGRDRNFWDLGQGPCGPCTEIYYDRGERYDPQHIGFKLFANDIENDRYVEIWNIVFSQFNNDGKNNYTELAQKNIDTGAGLERLASVLQEGATNFDTDLFLPIISAVAAFSPYQYCSDDYFVNDQQKQRILTSFRVIADHLKATTFAIADGVAPGPKGRNYIIRRLIRRTAIHARYLQLRPGWISPALKAIMNIYADFFPHLQTQASFISTTLTKEINAAVRTANDALDRLANELKGGTLNTQSLFKLVETYGLPTEAAKEYLAAAEIDQQTKTTIDWNEFETLLEQHRTISRAGVNVQAIEKQNPNLMRFQIPSVFDYTANHIKAKVIALFDEQFNQHQAIDGAGYAVFDRTVLYASSGGQRYDEGFGRGPNGQLVTFSAVYKAPHLQHLHRFEDAQFNVGETWELWHDPQWRAAVKKNHTLEHVMHSALKKVISSTIKQEGAFKSAQKATLDFSYPTKLSDAQLTAVEDEIRRVIALNLPVEIVFTDLAGAKAMNALAYFDDEYKKHGQQLRVIKISDYSVELCGGTHVSSTSEIEDCYITHHTALGSGSWRIEIISGKQNIAQFLTEKSHEMADALNAMITELKTMQLTAELKSFQQFVLPISIRELRAAQHAFSDLENQFRQLKLTVQKQATQAGAQSLKTQLLAKAKDDWSILVIEDADLREINLALNDATNEIPTTTFVVLNVTKERTQYLVAAKNPRAKRNAREVINVLNQTFAGRGGGREHFAQGGCQQIINLAQLHTALATIN